MRSKPSLYARNIAAYRQLEQTHRRWRTIRRRFDLTIEAAAFFIGQDELLTPGAWKRQARSYFAALLDYERLERTNDLLCAHRLQKGWSLGEAAFLFAGAEDANPLPNKLQAARLRTGLSQEDVASIIAKPRHLLARYERGERNPDLVTAMSLSILYDLPLNKLFPQGVGALHARLKKRERMLAAWRRTRQHPPASSAP